jgi:hypothetical protein
MKAMAATKDAAAAAESAEATDLQAMVPDQFEVRDRASAEWLVRKVVEADAYIDRVKHQANREIRRTQRERDFLLFRYGPQLERWTRQQLEQTKGRRKSVLLLAGTVGFRQTCAKLVVDDQMAVIKWAKRFCTSAVVVVERLSRSTLKSHLTTTGELPAGAHLEPARQKFYVK